MATKEAAAPVGHHVQPYISEPFSAVQIVIDGGKDKVERIHAALGVLDFAAVTFIPHDHPQPVFGADGVAAHVSKSEEELCAEISTAVAPKAATGDVSAFPWQIVLPMLWSLIERWLNR